MLFKALSAAVYGIDAYVVEVEVDISAGNGIFLTVGLPDAAVKESKERIRSAIKNCGLDFPFQNITVNLAPADIKKEGSAFDLPMAIGILGTNGTLLKQDLADYLFLGELSLDGGLRPIKGALSIALNQIVTVLQYSSHHPIQEREKVRAGTEQHWSSIIHVFQYVLGNPLAVNSGLYPLSYCPVCGIS